MKRLIQGGFLLIGFLSLGFVFLLGRKLYALEQEPVSKSTHMKVLEGFKEGQKNPSYAEIKTQSEGPSSWAGLAFLAAALAFGLGAIGAGLAVGNVGSAAMGTLGEKPELFGQTLIFIGLAEGIVIFGFIVAWTILGKI